MSCDTPAPVARPSTAPRRTLLAPAPGERLRRVRGYFFEGLCVASAVVVLVPLFLIFIYVVSKGLSGLSLDFYRRIVKDFPATPQADEAAARIEALGAK